MIFFIFVLLGKACKDAAQLAGGAALVSVANRADQFLEEKNIMEKVSGRDQARDRDRVSGSSETRVPSPPSSSSSSLAHPSPLVMFTRTTALAAAAATVALTFGVSTASAQSIPATASAEELALVSAQFSNSGFNLSTVSCRERV